MTQDALASLYEINPGSRRAIERSAGHAVFSTFIDLPPAAPPQGMVVNRRTSRQTFMKMVQVQGASALA